jgi:hypothetical protein
MGGGGQARFPASHIMMVTVQLIEQQSIEWRWRTARIN